MSDADPVDIGLSATDQQRLAGGAGEDRESGRIFGKAARADHRFGGGAQRPAMDVAFLVPVGIGEQTALLHANGAVAPGGTEGVASEIASHGHVLTSGTGAPPPIRTADIPRACRRGSR